MKTENYYTDVSNQMRKSILKELDSIKADVCDNGVTGNESSSPERRRLVAVSTIRNIGHLLDLLGKYQAANTALELLGDEFSQPSLK